MDCPNEHGWMGLKSMVRELLFRGKRVKFRARHYVCPVCGIEADDLDMGAANVCIASAKRWGLPCPQPSGNCSYVKEQSVVPRTLSGQICA
jgi:hypothetical protein